MSFQYPMHIYFSSLTFPYSNQQGHKKDEWQRFLITYLWRFSFVWSLEDFKLGPTCEISKLYESQHLKTRQHLFTSCYDHIHPDRFALEVTKNRISLKTQRQMPVISISWLLPTSAPPKNHRIIGKKMELCCRGQESDHLKSWQDV